MEKQIKDTQTSYDQVAAEYAEKFKDEMDDKPFDRDCLDRLAQEVGDLGPICDMGCDELGALSSLWLALSLLSSSGSSCSSRC